MKIFLYNNKSENFDIHKDLTLISELEGSLKGETNLEEPSILIEGSSCLNANYAHIPEFNRYYFFKSPPTIVRNNLFNINLRSDVLMSFKEGILSSTAILEKQENLDKSNLYIDDGSYVFENRLTNQVVMFPNKFNDNGEYILLTAGGM